MPRVMTSPFNKFGIFNLTWTCFIRHLLRIDKLSSFFRTEKNATDWSKNKIRQLLENLEIDDPGLGKCKITSVESIDGEAFANNRKAKLIFFYEWVIKAKWEGNLNGQTKEKEVKGEIEIPNLSEENDPEEIEIQVTVKTGSGTVAGDALKELLRNKGTEIIRNCLATYISELKTDFAKDLILPTKDSKSGDKLSSNIKHEGKSQVKTNVANVHGINNVVKDEDKSQQSSYKSLRLTESMKCKADELYNAFIIPELVCAFTRGNATVEAKVGGTFSMFDGNITGTFTSLKAPTCIKQKWRFSSWPKDYYSDVTITINQQSDETKVTVDQTGIPFSDYERTENGWRMYYFESIKRTFGFGASLY